MCIRDSGSIAFVDGTLCLKIIESPFNSDLLSQPTIQCTQLLESNLQLSKGTLTQTPSPTSSRRLLPDQSTKAIAYRVGPFTPLIGTLNSTSSAFGPDQAPPSTELIAQQLRSNRSPVANAECDMGSVSHAGLGLLPSVPASFDFTLNNPPVLGRLGPP